MRSERSAAKSGCRAARARSFAPTATYACWRVQRALDEQRIDYEIVKEPTLPRSRRKEVERLSAQRLLPVIEFEGGDAYRAESVEMASTIRAGKLFDIVGGRSRG